MKSRIITTIIAMAAIVGCVQAKVTIGFGDGYKMAETTQDGVNIRSGAGTQYPIASYMEKSYYDGRLEKFEVPQAFKGQRLWVKDAGTDWWEIEPQETYESATKQFVSKKFVKIVETEPFDIPSITEPQVWAKAEKMQYGDEEGDEDDGVIVASIVTIYPEGLAVTQYYSPEEDALAIGGMSKDGSSIFNRRIASMEYVDAPSATAPLKIAVDGTTDFVHFKVSYGDANANIRHAVVNAVEFNYFDLTAVPVEKYGELYNSLKEADTNEYTRHYYREANQYLTRDELERTYTRIK